MDPAVPHFSSLTDAACAVLAHPHPPEKIALTREIAEAWASGEIPQIGTAPPPDRPARPQAPLLLPPRDMPKRGYSGDGGRIALIHALAHIEFNAIDLAWDIVARFPAEDWPKAFYDDWIQVAVDEALHFEMLSQLLRRLGSDYGALPAHDGLWQAATKTADDALARLAVVPMTLEARGLDTTPATVARLRRNGDDVTADALDVIYRDEIAHVAAGCRWFRHACVGRGLDPASRFPALIAERFPGGLKPPFNHEARAQAGFPRPWYEAAVSGAYPFA